MRILFLLLISFSSYGQIWSFFSGLPRKTVSTPTGLYVNYIDSFVKGTGNNQCSYFTTWGDQTKSTAYAQTQSVTNAGTNDGNNANDPYVLVYFNGYKVELIGEKFPLHGIMAYSIDGGAETTYDQYNVTEIPSVNPVTLVPNVLWTISGLTNGDHVLKIRNTGAKNVACTDTGNGYLVFDAVRVTSNTSTTPPSTPTGDWYVGYTGASDSNTGTGNGSGQSFATIQKASTVAQPGDVITIKPGTYRETITPTNSGTVGNPIIYQSDGTGDVIVSGLNTVGTSWTVHSGNIYKTTITLPTCATSGLFNTTTGGSNTQLLALQLFQGGTMQNLARWPNADNVDGLLDRTKQRARLNATLFSATQITDAGFPAGLTGAWVSISGWILNQTQLISAHSGNTITFPTIITYDVWHQQFYTITGKLGLLDQAGEWFYDSGTTTLYLWQTGGGSPTNVEYKARNWGFNLNGKSNITIQGLKFIGCDPVTSDALSVNITIDNIRASYMNHAFLHPTPGQNYFYTAEQVGTKLLGAGSVIKNSELTIGGAHGVWLGTNTRAENNLVTHIAYDGMWGAAFMPWEGSTYGQVITKNTIHTTGRSGINLADNVTSHLNMDISYNDIYNHTRLNLDNGAIYGGIQVDFTGTRIHHNWFHDIGTQFSISGVTLPGLQVTGVYLDQASGPCTIDHNVQWGTQSSVAGCDFFTEQVNAYRNTGGHKLYNNTFWSATPYATYISWQTTVSDVQRNNVYRYANNLAHGANPGNIANSVMTGTNPLFNGGSLSTPQIYFGLQSGSPALNIGTSISGITTDAIGAPDAGAYERGATPWTAGYTAVTYVPTP